VIAIIVEKSAARNATSKDVASAVDDLIQDVATLKSVPSGWSHDGET
jgi:hypothetical protein